MHLTFRSLIRMIRHGILSFHSINYSDSDLNTITVLNELNHFLTLVLLYTYPDLKSFSRQCVCIEVVSCNLSFIILFVCRTTLLDMQMST